MGRVVLGVVGAAIGAYVGGYQGAYYGFLLGYGAAPGIESAPCVEGPYLAELRFTDSQEPAFQRKEST